MTNQLPKNRDKTKGKRKRKLYSPVKKKKPGRIVKLLQKMPGWFWWAGGVSVVVIYLFLFYYLFIGPFGFNWRPLFGVVYFPEGYEVRGIDISHHQGEIDWGELCTKAKIGESPVRFVFAKATEGSDLTDKCFADNFQQARENGYARGAYHFWSYTSGAKTQAWNFIKNVKLEKGDLPPVLDVENKPMLLSARKLTDSLKVWLDIVEKHYGVTPIIYTNYKFKKDNLKDSLFDRYPLWIAHYGVDSLASGLKWDFWQHTEKGQLPGIDEYVDLNVFNGSFDDLQEMTIK